MSKYHIYVDAHLRASSAAESIRSFVQRGQMPDLSWVEEMCQHIDVMDEVARSNVVEYTG